METPSRQNDEREGNGPRSVWLWMIGLVCLTLLSLSIISRLGKGRDGIGNNTSAPAGSPPGTLTGSTASRAHVHTVAPVDRRPPDQIVAEKLIQFAKSRRAITHAMAKRFNVPVPPDVESFFDIAETGRWEELKAAFVSLQQSKQAAGETAVQMNRIWGPIHETFGVAEVVHEWPAQELLDYGQAVLGSLRSGMVYAGGTDAGRFIPTLLNGTSGDPNVVLTQNALADNSYREYVDFLYGDRMNTLSQADSDRVFQEYLADAQKRLQQNQLRPGEDVKFTDGRLQVSGQVAVMAINERLFQQIMDKNPSMSFAIEQSFPFKSTYANAGPLGPVMEVNVPAEHPFGSEMASQSIDYWNTTVQQLLGDQDAPVGSEPRKAWSKMISSQADLFADRQFGAEAEQAYALALKLAPDSPEAVFRYVNLLLSGHRAADAEAVAANALKVAPDNAQFRDLLEKLKAQDKH